MKPEPALPEDGSIKAVSPDGRRLLIMWRTAACPPCTLYDAIVDRATGTKVGTTVEEMLSQPTPLGGVHVVEKSASLLTWTGTVVPVPLLVPQNRSTDKPSVFADGAVTPTIDGFAMLARDGAVEIGDATGALLVVPSMNGATIYDLATGTAQRELVYATAPGAGAGSPVYSAQFSPDGTRMVGVGANGLVLEWDAASGRELHRYAATTGDVLYARYSRDGSLLVTSHEHGPARIWNTRTGELVTVRAFDLAPSASDIETATAHVPWKLVDGILVPSQVPAFGAAN